MTDKCDVKKAGITLGIIYALYHLTWVMFVALGGSGLVNLRKDGTRRMYSLSEKGKRVLEDISRW